MALPTLLHSASVVLRQVEPLIVLEQLGSSLFDTALSMVVKDRGANASYPDRSREESQQKAFTDFYMTYNLIIRFVPILPALLLARLSDRGWRRAALAVPLSGYLLSRIALLLLLVFRLPLEVMFGAAVVFGLSGGFGAYWPGVMTLASLGSTAEDRSKVKQVQSEDPEENCHLLTSTSDSPPAAEPPAPVDKVTVVLLFVAAFLYDFAVGGAVEILGAFVLKAPLSWTAAQVGYGNAAGCAIFLTSFLGVIVFRRCVSDVMLILIGMMSFASGMYFMSFVTTTLMFYLARSLNLFALIPMTTIRALVSQQVPASWCSTALTCLQLTLKFAGLAYIPTFTKIYQGTLDWFPGFVFILASSVTVLGMIPISIVGCRLGRRRQHETIQED
ncbi:thymic stromal cotransporter homolog [Stegastes partitus]|uniref:Solute carrier family 46 member 2 n=1 Tax=Stegastes partitus TaxID=144197 RepID=A0A3B5A0I0_9TELE|nr:PREDICTED: thymic stromal cotransporter homolog [Stegastes partitus]